MSTTLTKLVRELAAYGTSRDYARLAELVKRQSVICVLDYRTSRDPEFSCRDVAKTTYTGYPDGDEIFEIGARGIGYLWAKTPDDFVAKCRALDVEFFEPPIEIRANPAPVVRNAGV